MIVVFSKQWFKKYNKWIVKLAKLPFIGEWIFRIKKYGFDLDRNNILEIQPNAVVEDMKLMWTKCVRVNGQWVAYDCTNALHNRLIKKECKEKLLPTKRNHYFVRNEFALRLQSVFYPIWITFHIWDIITRPFPQLNLGFDTLTVSPGSIGTDDPICGYVGRSGVNEDFSTIRAGAGNENDHGAVIQIVLKSSTSSGKYEILERGIINFDCSTLGSDATISDSEFNFYCNFASNYVGDPTLHLCSVTPDSTTDLADDDYGQFGSTSFGSIDYDSITTNDRNSITMNASGRASIDKTGITSIGIRLGWDILNNTTGLYWLTDSYSRIHMYTQKIGSAYSPKLVVTYTLPVVAPTVTTQDADTIATTSVRGNGNITATGGANATRRGFCYKVGTSGDPTTADSVAYDDGSFGTGAFTKSITGLTPNTSYRVRAYAVNSAGTSYGTTVDVKTLSAFKPRITLFN